LTKTDLRNLLAPDIMEALQILKYSYKKNGKVMLDLDFTGHLCRERETAELDAIAAQIALPETDDVTDYVESFWDLPQS
jgi:hypothetical protein